MSTATQPPTDTVTDRVVVADALDGGTALARWCEGREPYVLYERDGEVGFGAGAEVELALTTAGLAIHENGGWRTEPLGADPIAQVADAVSTLVPPGRRAFGWASFELSYLLHGLPVPEGAGDLLRIVLPRDEARLAEGVAELRVTDRARAQAWIHVLSAEHGPAGVPLSAPVDESAGAEEYRAIVAAAVEDIAADRIRKVILSRAVPVEVPVDLVATYREGRRHNTPARSFLLDLGGTAAAGFSPETIIEVAGDGSFSTQPLAGTRALSGDAAADAVRHDELLSDPKEVYEHAVSVQVARDEVAGVSRPGSVLVDEFMQVVERGSVQHLASRVRGRLRPGVTCWHAFAQLFPAVTASGLPKAGAVEAIVRHEDGPRGLYSGAVLLIEGDGGLDAALVLRTLYRQHGRTWLRAGAGIVGQSTPERELEETREKLRSVSRFLVAEGTEEGPR